MRAASHLCLLALALLLHGGGAGAQDAALLHVDHDLSVDLDPHARRLRVEDDIALRGRGRVEITLSARYRVEHASIDGRPLSSSGVRDDLHTYEVTLSGEADQQLRLHYSGELAALTPTDHRGTLRGLQPMAGDAGSYLPAGTGWYPQVGDALMRYRLALHLPAGQRGLVPGHLLEESETESSYRARYVFAQPAEGIDLMVGPYVVQSRAIEVGDKRVHLRTWFHPEIAQLAPAYLDSTQRYIGLYSARIGDYPFEDFSIVSSPLPTGFGMPTLTYLGVDVLKLPFIRATSLGHEVLHNWWGNGVYVDYASGNWAEGLTTFMADYAYQEAEGDEAARAMRQEWLRDFAAIPAEQDTPLRAFTARTHGTSQIVGYHKAAFVFFMLREEIGAKAFEQGLHAFWQTHRFRQAGWDDLRAAFEGASGRTLSGFFRQWLERSGAPRVRIEHVRQAEETLHVTLVQETPAYALAVPVRLESAVDTRQALLRLTQTRQTFTLPAPSTVQAIVLDPDSHVLRLLPAAELAPILRNVMLDPSTRLHVASEDPAFREAARELAHAFLDYPPTRVDTPAADGPWLIIAPSIAIDAVLAQLDLPPRATETAASGTAQVWATKTANGSTAVVVAARDHEAVSALQRSLPHYGRQSWLIFDGARVTARGIWPAQPQRVEVSR